jgi:hypothetical protein
MFTCGLVRWYVLNGARVAAASAFALTTFANGVSTIRRNMLQANRGKE